MVKRSLSFKIAKFFGRKSSGSASKKTADAVSVRTSALMSPEDHPISEIAVVTEVSRGLGRRIPYANDEIFVGIVNYHYVYDSTKRPSPCSGPKSPNNSKTSCKEKKSSGVEQQRNREESRPSVNVEIKARSDLSSFGDKYKGIYELDEPLRSLLIKDICQPINVYELCRTR